MVKKLQLPPHYSSDQAYDDKYIANADELATAGLEWRRENGLNLIYGDRKKIHMLVIDAQNDFTFPSGRLPVLGRSGTGAMDAQKNLVEFIYRNLGIITQITCTMDTHIPYQIFYPAAHVRKDGGPVLPNLLISADDYEKEYQASIEVAMANGVSQAWLTKQFIYYCQQLEKKGKESLTLWPQHCMLGDTGHALTGVVQAARLFHSYARGATNLPETKGGLPLTEHYSIFAPEVTGCFDGQPIPGAEKNTDLIKTLVDADIVILAGEASSHCVKESIKDFLNEIMAQDPVLARKVYIMRDCMAPVVVKDGNGQIIPFLDFTDMAEEALAEFQNAGMHVVKSTTPIEDWPDVTIV